MIESPPLFIEDHIGPLDRRLRQTSEGRRSGRRIFLLVQFPWKAAKVVDRFWFVHAGDERTACVPMRGYTQNRTRFGQLLTDRIPRTAEFIVLDRIHWIAVTDE